MTIEEQLRGMVRDEVRRALAERGDQEPATGEYLDTRGVSEMVKLAVVTLEQMRARGKGPRYTRAGRRVLYARADVEAWLKAGQG